MISAANPDTNDEGQNKNTRLIIAARFFSDFGAFLNMIALTTYVYVLTQDVVQISIFLACRVLGGIVASIVGVPFFRRMKGRLSLITFDLTRALLLAMLLALPPTILSYVLPLIALGLGFGNSMFAMVTSYAGVVLVVCHDVELAGLDSADTLYGAWLVLLSAIVYAGYLLVSGQLIPKLGASRFTAMTMSLAALASAAHFGASGSFDQVTALPNAVYVLAFLMALIATVLPSVLMNLGIHQLGSRKAALISAIGPVAMIVLAYLFLGESLSWIQVMGTALVLVGVMAVSLEKPPRAPEAVDADA